VRDDDDDDDDDTTTTLYAGTPIKNKTPLPGGHNGAPHTHTDGGVPSSSSRGSLSTRFD